MNDLKNNLVPIVGASWTAFFASFSVETGLRIVFLLLSIIGAALGIVIAGHKIKDRSARQSPNVPINQQPPAHRPPVKKPASMLALAAVLIFGNGCFLDSMVKATGTPIVTNYVPSVFVVTNTTERFVTNTVTVQVTNTLTGATVTNFVPVIQPLTSITFSAVTNLVPVIEYGPKPSIETGIAVARTVAEASGVPWLGTIVGTLGAVFGALFGISNKKRAAEAMGKVNFMQTASDTLVDNVEVMKKLALDYAKQLGTADPTLPNRVNDYANTVLRGAQQAAGVEDFIRSLVNKQTGYTKQEAGLTPTP